MKSKATKKESRIIIVFLVLSILLLGALSWMTQEYHISRNTNIRQSCGISKEDYVRLLSRKTVDRVGFFSRNAEYLWDISQDLNLNEFLMPAIIALETAFGKTIKANNNYANFRFTDGKLIAFETERDCIDHLANLLSANSDSLYANQQSLKDLSTLWCPDTTEHPNQSKLWCSDIISCIKKFSRGWLPQSIF